MTFDFHKLAESTTGPETATRGAVAPDTGAHRGRTSLLRRLLDGLAARRHRRDMDRLTAHLAWTSEQRAALQGRSKRRD